MRVCAVSTTPISERWQQRKAWREPFACNLKTGAEIKIAPSKAPTFKAGKGLKDAVSN